MKEPRRKSIAFILPGFYQSGGVHIIVRWAQLLCEAGHAVTLLVPDAQIDSPIPSLFLPGGTDFAVRGHSRLLSEVYDAAIATWWETLHLLHLVRARSYAALVQALELQFHPPGDPAQEQYRRLIRSGVQILTIAHWLRDYLVRYFGVAPDCIRTVLNPLCKTTWRRVPPLVPPGQRVRFLVEGSVDEERKNVAQVVQILEELGVEYLWVGARTDRRITGAGCVGVLDRVPYAQMPAVYSSCDVLVKTSSAEGMFGPPLEMFSTGGTAIAWDVWGAEEYMAHGYNSLLVPMNSLPAVRRSVRELATEPALLARLKRGALRTAAQWPDWPEQRHAIVSAVEDLPENDATGLARESLRMQLSALPELFAHNPRALYNPFDLSNYSARSFLAVQLRNKPLWQKLGRHVDKARDVWRHLESIRHARRAQRTP